VSIRQASLLGPVHVTFSSATLYEVGDHHDDVDLLFPDHSPKGFKGLVQRALRTNVGLELLESVNVVCIDVVRVALAGQCSECNSAVVVGNNVQVPVLVLVVRERSARGWR